MNKSITNINQLQTEKQELKLLLAKQQAVLRNDFVQLQLQLEPAYKLLNGLGSLTKKPGLLSILNFGLGLGRDIVIGSKLFRKTGPLLKFGLPVAVGVLNSKILSGSGLLQKIGRLLKGKPAAKDN